MRTESGERDMFLSFSPQKESLVEEIRLLNLTPQTLVKHNCRQGTGGAKAVVTHHAG
jgi:hypothetical protein